jgi:hypothetical protein
MECLKWIVEVRPPMVDASACFFFLMEATSKSDSIPEFSLGAGDHCSSAFDDQD